MPHLTHGRRLGFGQDGCGRGDVVVAQTNFADGVGECQEVIPRSFGTLGRTIQRQPDHFPAARHTRAGGMLGAQVEGPGDTDARQGAENGRGIRIHVGQRCHGGEDAGCP